jgi:uncharacterized protein (TIGR00369 family)
MTSTINMTQPCPPGSSKECSAWQTLLEGIPYSVHLGLEARALGSSILIYLPYREALIGNFMLPALHGGVIGALMEITALVAAQRKDLQNRNPRILGSNVNYLRSAQASPTFAKAQIIRQGRRTSLVEIKCWQSDESCPVASGQVRLLFNTASLSQ